MTIERKLLSTSPSGGAPDVAEVFSIDLFNGNNGTNAINNGIDLSGEGGLVWAKRRGGSGSHGFFDTERGANKILYPNNTDAQLTATDMSSFNSNGFTMGVANQSNFNNSNVDSVAWTFRKKEKFFDIVTYTGNGVAGRQIAHSLGSVPAMIITKSYNSGANWDTYHSSMGNTEYIHLNTNATGTTGSTRWNNTTPTDSVFTLGVTTNSDDNTYIAYLFADNSSEDAEEQMIKCGSYVGNGNANGPVVNLGWEPQFLLIKNTSYSHDWVMLDVMRGVVTTGDDAFLRPNTTGAEDSDGGMELNATGFKIADSSGILNENNNTFIYMAIRAPMMKEPEAATDVFAMDTRGSSAATADGVVYHSNFPVDMTLARNVTYQGGSMALYNRSRGDLSLFTDTNAVEASQGGSKWDSMHGFDVRTLSASTPNMAWMWKKAKGFMDVVCYRGSGNAGNVINGYHTHTIPHSLGVIPELVIIKNRATNGQPWQVASPVGNGFLSLNEGDPYNSNVSRFRNKHLWSDTTFNVVGAGNVINASGAKYVAQLFATLEGISKVGTFTGSGSSSQTINCGFSAGARFIMIKRTDSDGTWFMWDYVRGIASGNEPWLGLNNNNAHTTNTDIIDPHNSGFIVRPTQGNPNNMNNSSATYLFYAIA